MFVMPEFDFQKKKKKEAIGSLGRESEYAVTQQCMIVEK